MPQFILKIDLGDDATDGKPIIDALRHTAWVIEEFGLLEKSGFLHRNGNVVGHYEVVV